VAKLESVDTLVAAILVIALLRGLLLGLIREAFSIGALGAACVGVRMLTAPAASWLQAVTHGAIGAGLAPWIAGAGIAIATIAAVATLGRLLQRGARAAGLGWADRAGGAALGTAEGALVAGLLLLVLGAVIGRDHPFVAGSRSIAALERVEQLAETHPIDVAAPPPPRR